MLLCEAMTWTLYCRAARTTAAASLQQLTTGLQQQAAKLASAQQVAAAMAARLDEQVTQMRGKQSSDHDRLQSELEQHVNVRHSIDSASCL
jgi:hypothetical protein